MQITLPYKVRAAIYVANGLLAPVAGYLLVIGVIGANEMALFTAEFAFAFLLAGLNVNKTN